MTTLEDLAEDTPTVYGIEDARGVLFTIESLDPVDADEVGDEKYPKYGHWLAVTDEDGTETHVQLVQGLAKLLVEADAEEGDVFELVSVTERRDGTYYVEGGVDVE